MNATKMKAIVATQYGDPDVLQLQEVARPVPADNEVLIKVYAATATAADSMMRRAEPFISRFFLGLTKPKIPVIGTGFAGIIVAVGKAVQEFKEGDRVFGETGVRFSANAEYVSVPEDGVLATLPASMSYEEAAPLCDGALTSLNFLKELARIQPGQKVLVNGASGSLGTAAIQLAKHFGAEVTGVCSAANIDLVKSLGADEVIDYTTTHFTQTGQTYDVIFDTVGKSSYARCKGALSEKGVYLSPVLKLSLLFQMLWTAIGNGKKAKFSATGLRPPYELRQLLEKLKSIIEGGHLKTIIDRQYSLEQVVDAHRYVDTGRKRGNVVIMLIPH